MAGESARAHATEAALLRAYYCSGDHVTTPEGIMKMLAILSCLASGVLFLWGGACAGASRLAAGGASAALGSAALLALQLAATLLGAARLAPHLHLYTDVVVCAAVGALLLLAGALSPALCEPRPRGSYVHAGLALVGAALATGAAGGTYRAVTRRWDAARGPAREPRRAPPPDLDV